MAPLPPLKALNRWQWVNAREPLRLRLWQYRRQNVRDAQAQLEAFEASWEERLKDVEPGSQAAPGTITSASG